ncbi:hypothetical protein TNCT_710841 [Trichonephila clavata]|uniref:Uncharacterized protein n=1 Tax=Trichonephila clavata TaxID=2740835 RepID=A0A8X6G5M3_TRICU|nr:hypothetical protein TNCT_71051 [Trichonephila clavata]GFR03220.1 hypothetical protein TNCT_710841 [Trichonephila clavata]
MTSKIEAQDHEIVARAIESWFRVMGPMKTFHPQIKSPEAHSVYLEKEHDHLQFSDKKPPRKKARAEGVPRGVNKDCAPLSSQTPWECGTFHFISRQIVRVRFRRRVYGQLKCPGNLVPV